MHRILEHMGYGGGLFTGMIRTLYKGAKSKFEVDGSFTEAIDIKGGLRQGCPLSAFLFIMMIETLAERIRKNGKIKGLKEPTTGQETKIILFADDVAGIMEDMESAEEFRKDFIIYEEATASKVNDDKTVMIPLGTLRERE